MKPTTIITISLLALALSAHADDKSVIKAPKAETTSLTRNGSKMEVAMQIPVGDIRLSNTQAVLLTPAIVNEADTLRLPPIGLYSRTRWIQYQRLGRMIAGPEETSLKSWTGTMPYTASANYSDWMNGAHMAIICSTYSCCYNLTGVDIREMPLQYFEPIEFPTAEMMRYMRPEASGEKKRKAEGTAWVQFPVDQTIIYPERYNNPAELGKIRATIDTLRSDIDITLQQVDLKGFASPESPYQHNTDLAKGRTEALRTYINNLYHFPADLVKTSYEPEDWAGLRLQVEKSAIDHKAEILALIDTDMDPDKKEATIKKQFPEQYAFMLREWYPALRHTNYTILYTIRKYTTPEEALAMARTKPQNMSAEEFHLAAQALEPGTQEHADLWETAVRLYPEDQVANANAAANALLKHDTEAAAKYLEKAGNSPEATFNTAILYILTDHYDLAEQYLDRAQRLGVAQAAEAREALQKIKKYGRKK